MINYEQKEINSTCYCDKRLYSNESLSIIYPCEHIIHSKCNTEIKICPLCKKKYKKNLSRVRHTIPC